VVEVRGGLPVRVRVALGRAFSEDQDVVVLATGGSTTSRLPSRRLPARSTTSENSRNDVPSSGHVTTDAFFEDAATGYESCICLLIHCWRNAYEADGS
jgi:hypothetical protein